MNTEARSAQTLQQELLTPKAAELGQMLLVLAHGDGEKPIK